MIDDLSLSFFDKTQAYAVTEESSKRAKREPSGVPKWVQEAGTILERFKSFSTPREMVLFLLSRCVQVLPDGFRSRRRRLAVVERLRCHLAGMIYAHERSTGLPLRLGQRLVRHGFCWVWSRGLRLRG